MARSVRRKGNQPSAKASPAPAVPPVTEPSPDGDVTLEAPAAEELAESAGTDQAGLAASVETGLAHLEGQAVTGLVEESDGSALGTVEIAEAIEPEAPEPQKRTLIRRRFGGKGDHDGDGNVGGAAPAVRVVTESENLGGGIRREKSLHELNREAQASDRIMAARRVDALAKAQALYRELTGEELVVNPTMPHPIAPAVSASVAPLAAPVVPPVGRKE